MLIVRNMHLKSCITLHINFSLKHYLYVILMRYKNQFCDIFIVIDNASIYSKLSAPLLMKIVHAKHFMTLCFSGHCTACKLINNEVIGIFGPQDKLTASYVQSICDTLDIPYIVAR